ncbi:MAG: peptide deformylase [Sphingomonadaceae bacterium]|uniref:peptide deformylase n=1 Tax=Thermaurantiacus sp. TaxID=2820283 RepID=UPI00298F3C16|nr:peptide deformylase [Thermaurantiacus sp.]MCS6986466.1 peptide deformylase [Sphingomonadaceae bacterium]MDW8414273.1 peptide deformylase [Thermaurantiacus sp.]
MAILPILEVPDPRLRRVATPVEAMTDALGALIADMFETMYAAPGIGLAAPQVDRPIRLLVMDLMDGPPNGEGRATRNPRVFINPEILERSAELSVYNEGCLSVPDQYAEVERPARVRARWRDEHWTLHEAELDGLLATCLQHELDHLNGVLFIDRLSRLKREMVLKRLQKQRQEAARRAAA